MQNGTCAKLNFQCIGSIPENAMLIPGDDIGLTKDIPITLVTNDSSEKCEYICNDYYVKGKSKIGDDICLKCKEGSRNSSNRVCEAIPECLEGYIAAPSPKDGGKLKCFPLGSCEEEDGKINNATKSSYRVREAPKNFRPISKNMSWSYVESSPRENLCEYTCPKDYLNDSSSNRCYKIKCFSLFPGSENIADTYSYTPHVTSQGHAIWDWIFVESQIELDQKRTKGEKGCFYYCPKENQYQFSTGGIIFCYSEQKIKEIKEEKEEFSCTEGGLRWRGKGMLTIRNPQQKDHPWTYISDKTTFSSKSNDPGCFWTCESKYTKGERNGYHGCYASCGIGEYRGGYGFGSCSSCGQGQIGDENSPKIFGNPSKCRGACNDKPGTIWIPNGGEYGSCVSAAGLDLSCPEGMTLVQIKGENKCLSCLGSQILNTTTGLCE